MMEEPRCTMTVTGKHNWVKEIHPLGWIKYKFAKCVYCGMIDDREEVSDK